jgi:hypothetical protein
MACCMLPFSGPVPAFCSSILSHYWPVATLASGFGTPVGDQCAVSLVAVAESQAVAEIA